MTSSKQSYTNFRIEVATEFEAIFSHFYFAGNDTEQPIKKTFLPTYQTILIFSFGNPVFIKSARNTELKIERCIILGPIKFAFDYLLPVGSEILVINFKADAFYRFFGNIPIVGQLPVNPDELLQDKCFTDLWVDLKKRKTVSDRIDRILEFSRPYIKNREAGLEAIANWNEKSGALNPIKTIAQETKQTERTVQLNHKKYLGFSAKEINRYNRFLKAIELIQQILSDSEKVDWHEIINQCNYYDQSQLIRDFNHFMSISPKMFLKFQQDICYKTPD